MKFNKNPIFKTFKSFNIKNSLNRNTKLFVLVHVLFIKLVVYSILHYLKIINVITFITKNKCNSLT